jgi:transcriptional regulator with XRE-family HTH domain
MSSAETLWKEHLRRLGGYIRAQREFSQLSQRQLARLAEVSDTYMSQLERGMHAPSIRVLKALSESLGIRPDQLMMYAAGFPVDEPEPEAGTEAAIRRDGRLTEPQKEALLGVLASYIESNEH